MENNEIYYTKKDVIEKYSPMFTEWSLSKLLREKRIKSIRIGRRIFISKVSIEGFIKQEEEKSIDYVERNFHVI